jgi:type III pantothenate kinase
LQLTIDIGNTRTKLGLFRKNELVEETFATGHTLTDLIAFGNRNQVQHAIVCSVAAPDPDLITGLTKSFKTMELTHDTPLPFRNAYQSPLTLGKDRIAAVAGAHALYPGESCLVVDCGTCIKYELLEAGNTYTGGNIAPGASMRIKAMHHFTARLPEVEMNLPADFVGHTTETALQNGALLGASLEIEGFARLFAQKSGPLRVILTGGDAGFFFPMLQIPNLSLEPFLTLIGLNNILLHNLIPHYPNI